MTIDLTCAVCGTKTGEYAITVNSEISSEEVTQEALGLSVRCDEHPEERALTSPSLPEVPQKSSEELAAEDVEIAALEEAES